MIEKCVKRVTFSMTVPMLMLVVLGGIRLAAFPGPGATERSAEDQPPAHAPTTGRAVALTFDDLPGTAVVGGNCDVAALVDLNRRLLSQLARFAAPATGFVTETRVCDELRDDLLPVVLSLWLDAGHDLGNHTYSHLDVNGTTLETYTRDIIRGERTVRRLLSERGRALRFFRHPLLHTGADPATKASLASFLDARGYTVAPVTIDNQEWIYSAVYARAKANGDEVTMRRVSNAYVPFMERVFAFFEEWSVEVVGREMPHVLLLHANELNADHFGELAGMMRRRGYDFVSLEDALKDEAYQLEDGYVGPRGLSWLHRWARTRGLDVKEEPREPAWLGELFRTYRIE
jgi:peptidoglycan/xylan/chitin deacetylase (PgdA/CDA1 family)